MRIHKFGVLLLLGFSVFGSPLVAQQPSNPAEAMQKMFEQFSQQANSFMPGMMGELSPEQKRRLERIEISKQEEDQAGKKAISVFLENAAKQKMKVVNSGRDVAYLQQLVKKIKPHMKNGIATIVFKFGHRDRRDRCLFLCRRPSPVYFGLARVDRIGSGVDRSGLA